MPLVPVAFLVPVCQIGRRTLPLDDRTYAIAQQPVGPQATVAAWRGIIRSAVEMRRSRIGKRLRAEKQGLVARGLPVTGVGAPVHVQGFPGHERGRLQVEDRFDPLPDLAHPPQWVQSGKEGVSRARA